MPRSSAQLPLLSLFSGAGGLDLGFEEAGFTPLLALDADPAAVETYNHNRCDREAPARVADLGTTAVETLLRWWKDVAKGEGPVGIVGGPPCQAFSVGNVHKDPGDPRRGLPLKYADILRKFHSEYSVDFFVLENVTGLLRPPHLSVLTEFLELCTDAGFAVQEPFVLNALSFGVPQQRRRLFVVGFDKRRGSGDKFSPPTGSAPLKTVRDAIADLPEPVIFERGVRPESLGVHRNHWCMRPRSAKFHALATGSHKNGRSFRKLDWTMPSWTVAYGHREVHVHPSGTRRLSVLEAMLLQGFPSRYELVGTLSDQYRLVSDAVPPPVGFALAKRIMAAVEPRSTTAVS